MTGALTAADVALFYMEDRSDPYWLDVLEQGIRVADCAATHAARIELDYIRYWVEIAQLEALFRL